MSVQTTADGGQASVKIQAPESGAEAPKPDQNQNKNQSERPAWLPEKFKSPEDLAKSYSELEKKLGEQSGKKATETPPPAKAPVQIEQTKAEEAVQKAGLDMASLEKEVLEKGDLSAESLKKLSDAGISKDQVDTYRRGVEAKAQDFENKIVSDLEGGREELDAALKWASEGLSKEEVESFNKIMALGDAEAGRLAVNGLMSKFNKADGPRFIDGTHAEDGADVFESMAQIIAAQSDPKYATDAAYRSKVEQKIMRTDYSKLKR